MTKQEVYSSAKMFLNNEFHVDDLEEDLVRITHLKKLISKLKNGKKPPNFRLIINHLIILFNVFHPLYVIRLIKASTKEEDWFIINTFLVLLDRSLDMVNIDRNLLLELKKEIQK
jgi:hypothetical protein